MPAAATEQEVLGYLKSLSNWGRWGPDDQLGTLNLVTPAQRVAAAALVREGITVSCAWDIEAQPQPDPALVRPQRIMLNTGTMMDAPGGGGLLSFAWEHLGLLYHGFSVTHLDSLCHAFWDGRMYNGYPMARVTADQGALDLAVTVLRDGVVTRGVLLDIAALKGKDWLDPGAGVFPEDLEAAEARAGVRVAAGDVLFLRTGNGRRKRTPRDVRGPMGSHASWDARCLPWLHARGVAMIGSDTANEVTPTLYSSVSNPIHAVGIVAMGLWLMDNCDLEDLSATCARLQRWAFQFTLAPLRWVGATGSPVNPIATF